MKLVSLFLLVIATGCARVDSAPSQPRLLSAAVTEPARPPSPAPPPSPTLPALEGGGVQRLELEGGGHAFVALPVGARDPRAVVVGVHGAGDRADWSCSEWQAVTAGWAFVVCPEGVPHNDPQTFVWGSAEAIATQADRAIEALRARYGRWVSDGPLIYGGWSQGATLAAQVVASRPHTYDRVVLVEVGHTPLDAQRVATSFASSGVRRAVVSCSSTKCRAFARDFEGAARRRGLPVRVNDVGLRGHVFDGPVVRSLGPTLVWMVDDEPRFAGLGAAVEARYSTD